MQSRPRSLTVLASVALTTALVGQLPEVAAGGTSLAAGHQSTVAASATRAEGLRHIVAEARRSARVPAVTAAVVQGRTITSATVGKVRRGHPQRVAPNAKFHLGSLSKAVLATAMGTLIEDGSVEFSTTLAEVFPGRADKIRPRLRQVTLRELLTHRSGLASYTAGAEFARLPKFHGTPLQKQSKFAWWLLKQKPTFNRGTFHYSNAGYTVAAQLAQKVTGESWRSLVQDRVFRPLGSTVWFGWPGGRGPGQPWGHVVRKGHLVPASPNAYRLPAVVAPAGNLSLSARGYARYLRVHLAGLRGNDTAILRARTIQALHHPIGDESYSCGWFETATDSGAPVSTHDGTAGTFYALAALMPEQRRAVVSVANVGGRRGVSATVSVVEHALGLSRSGDGGHLRGLPSSLATG